VVTSVSSPGLDASRWRRTCRSRKLSFHKFRRHLVDYNYWANDRILEAVSALTPEQFTQPLGNTFGSIRDTIAHICDAEFIWLSRWAGKQPTGFQKPDRIGDITAARTEWAELERRMREVLATLGPEGVSRSFE
jgi:uncharacterized damage-inducible protein DinB